MILPSKKVLSIFILTAALVVATIIAVGGEKSSEAISFGSNLVAGEKVEIPEKANWQSELGTLNSFTDTTTDPQSGADPEKTEETATDSISKSLISNYLTLKQNGSLNQESAQKLIDQTATMAEGLQNSVVLEVKLNVIIDGGAQTISNYGENLGRILRNNKPAEAKNEVQIITAALNSKDQSKINELDEIIAVYEKIAAELQKMPVPRTFVESHTDMVKGIKGIAFSLREMNNAFDDPIKSLASTELYGQSVTTFADSLNATKNFISRNKIIYKQGSGGYYLFHGL